MILAFVVFGFSAAAGGRLFNFLWDTFRSGMKKRNAKNDSAPTEVSAE